MGAPAFVTGSTIPVQCAWCKTYRSEDDRRLAEEENRPVSHGICAPCKALAFAADEEQREERPCR